MVEWSMKTLGWLEKLAWFVILVGVIIWVPPLIGGVKESRLIEKHAARNFIDVRSVSIGNSVVGDPVTLTVDRSIYQPFMGRYVVEIRTFPERVAVCIAGDRLQYNPSATMPETVTLAWWANDGECNGFDLPPGDYIVETTWTVENNEPSIPDQSETVESNPFTVSAVSPEMAVLAIEDQQVLREQIQNLQQQLQSMEVAE